MEIDHFDPREKKNSTQRYENLFLATRHCNLSKGEKWPNQDDLALGLRFLNPCEEQDFGEHIFEDQITYLLVGVTPAGKYHIRHCDLNAPHFVDERRDRARIWKLLNATPVSGQLDLAMCVIQHLQEQVNRMIPLHPYLESKALTA